jgi:hypothetical protein
MWSNPLIQYIVNTGYLKTVIPQKEYSHVLEMSV